MEAVLRRLLVGGIPLEDEEFMTPPTSVVIARDPSVPHAPIKAQVLTMPEKRQALRNALRYIPKQYHAKLAPEFATELATYGHIYMYRFRPKAYPMKAYPISFYPASSKHAAAIMLMIMNNLDPAVAQYPHELVTYGGNGSVFSHWGQYNLVMQYLSTLTDEQTLVMCSGHPQGLFPSSPNAPRVVVTNGMVIPNYSSKEEYERMYALGVSMYGQMTAGSYAYIGPQGIVHGTTLTILNAGRKYLHCNVLSGKVFVTSGLGGMSGAQGKAARIAGAVAIIAEVSQSAITKRHNQGWVDVAFDDLAKVVQAANQARTERRAIAIAYHGNVVDLWEFLAREDTPFIPELGSDQTSLHCPFQGGYYPVGLTYEESNTMMGAEPAKFKQIVQASLCRHVAAVNAVCAKGMRFWDYGNSFLLESKRAGADILKADGTFKYPSYVQDIMGDIFSLGFGPFRWVCTSGLPSDLDTTDAIAADVIKTLSETPGLPDSLKLQYDDNYLWITQAKANGLVVGSQARILYCDAVGRSTIAQAFNAAVSSGKIGPVVISRDHHDVSGTDSPFRETSNITDGSMFCADMAVQNFVGDAFRGATWVSLHNGGGVGWGEVINGGFGMLLDGAPATSSRAAAMLSWDVDNGVARRSWSGHPYAQMVIQNEMNRQPNLTVTMPVAADDDLILSQTF
ncbi:urocanate hydratase [Pelomyxa schiedti]|nr:urocanate hydratase [Pelomyxa schiedti]